MNKKNLAVIKFWSDTIVPDWKTYPEVVNEFRQKIWNVISDNNTDMDYIIVSSWSVKLWRREHWQDLDFKIAASLWQVRLMEFWRDVIWHNVSQVLVSYNSSIDFSKLSKVKFKKLIEEFHRLYIKSNQDQNTSELLKWLLFNWFVPIINFNDAVDNIELDALSRFQDNDKLFAYIVELVKHIEEYDKVYWVIYSNMPFCVRSEWKLKTREEIVTWRDPLACLLYYCNGMSNSWTWWMWSKLWVAYELVDEWYLESCWIASTDEKLSDALVWLCISEWSENLTLIK